MKNVRVSVCAFDEGRIGHVKTTDAFDPGRVTRAMDMARTAKLEGADLAVFPEMAVVLGYQNNFQYAEEIDGPVWSEVAQTAKDNDIFIAFNHTLLEDGVRYNATVLFNRQGEVEGKYAKAYPTNGELTSPHDADMHVAPGPGPIVLDTEIGKIGFAICFDLNFEELVQGYKALEPDLILFLSMFAGGHLCEHWAREIKCHFIGSVPVNGSRILNPLGRLQNELHGIGKQMCNTINIDSKVYHWDYNNKLLGDLRRKHGQDIAIEFSDAEGVFLLSSTGSTPLEHIENDVGLESWNAYYGRALQNINDARSGKMTSQEQQGAW